MKQEKAKTKKELERRIENAIVIVPKTKNTKSVYFDDKGLRLTITDDYAVIETGFHCHVFNQITSVGISRPYLYTKRVIDIALDNDCFVKDGTSVSRSYEKLLEMLNEEEDKTDYNIAVYYSWFVFNCFQPLYSIGESEVESFLVYEMYLHNIARQAVLLSEKKEDMTNKQFFNEVIKNMQDFIEGVDESVIFHKMTDEEMAQANISAIQEQEQEQVMEAQINESQD